MTQRVRTKRAARDALVEQAFACPDCYCERNLDKPLRPAVLRALLGSVAGKTVLDLGCGDGGVTLPLCREAERVTLVDRSASMLQLAHAACPRQFLERVAFVEADLLEFTSAAPSDVVVCLGVLAHVPSPSKVLERVSDLTAAGGLCALQITDGARLLGLVTHVAGALAAFCAPGAHYRKNFLTASSVVNMAAGYGLELVEVRYYATSVPGMSIIPQRWRDRLNRGERSRLMSEAMILVRRGTGEERVVRGF